MARFFPPSLDGRRASWGKERVFAYLTRALSDLPAAAVWYRPVLRAPAGPVQPDFLLIGPCVGVVAIEVRDWTPDRVRGGGEKRIRLAAAGETRVETREPHPERIAERALEAWTALLRANAPLRSAVAGFPLRTLVVLPAFDDRGLRGGAAGAPFVPERTLTGDGLRDGGALLKRLGRRKTGAWAADVVDRLRAVIQPQIHFTDLRVEPAEPPDPAPAPASRPAPRAPVRAESGRETGYFLDRKQERMARGLASPRTVIYGQAGSGKTVFLVSRARYWRDLNPEARILFTCFNSSLASHLRKEFQRRGIAADGERLSVIHYHDLCRGMLGMGADFHEKPPEFYAVLEPRVLQEIARSESIPTYDLILVDEGQDFTRRMVEVLARLAAPGGEITMVCDPAQDVYGRWETGNLSPLGDYAVERLVDSYRNTAPIFSLALSVLGTKTREAMGLDRLEMTRPEDLGRDGPSPRVPHLQGLDDLLGLITETAAEFERAGRPLSDLAVVYPNRDAIPAFFEKLGRSRWTADARRALTERERPPASGVGTLRAEGAERTTPARPPAHFAEALERELLARGVPAEWVARDFASKAAYDIAKTRLTLSTVHSAKGMDYHTVIVLGAETLPFSGHDPDPAAAALLFTAVTRARERLVLPYFERTGWIPLLEGLVAPE